VQLVLVVESNQATSTAAHVIDLHQLGAPKEAARTDMCFEL
jgi:hypothetical protein